MAKVVIDANVIISSAFGGKPLEAVIRAIGKHEVYISQSVKKELEGVIIKLSKKLSEEQLAFVREKFGELLGMAKLVSISTHVAMSRDAKDDHYLSLCKKAGADILITGDKDLLVISPESLKKNGVLCRIITPQEFVEGFYGRGPHH
ncbi:MAG: putative toxin-antitoxin system toxin component, PIN family [Deltaproteobacteria bacterium]|nr:putative toxin-antitoxin system toxin component, PIN family [Deltaproteobacteria bacterium]